MERFKTLSACLGLAVISSAAIACESKSPIRGTIKPSASSVATQGIIPTETPRPILPSLETIKPCYEVASDSDEPCYNAMPRNNLTPFPLDRLERGLLH